jgi:type III pantothenate kinase
MLLLIDIGNTHTHLGLADAQGVKKHADMPTGMWLEGDADGILKRFAGRSRLVGAACCSVVPRATPRARRATAQLGVSNWFELTARTAHAVIDPKYPKPATIGPDRLANAIASRHHHGSPCLAIDFGTAVTFDVVDRAGHFVGGVIAPGTALMTRYLHEKTSLLPRLQPRAVRRVIGRTTEEAMWAAAYHGFRGMVRELIRSLKQELGSPRMPVVATGGDARFIARGMAEITLVNPLLTLEGLRLAYLGTDIRCKRPV